MQTPIIKGLTDLDFYKCSMAQGALHQFPNAMVRYGFKCRNNVDLRPFAKQIREEIDRLGDLRATNEEIAFLEKIRYMKPSFISYFSRLQLRPDLVTVRPGKENLEIETEPAPWTDTIWFETMILGIVSEIYYRETYPVPDLAGARANLMEKIQLVQEAQNAEEKMIFRLIEFGTRRRFSADWQEEVTRTLKENIPNNLFGTSNLRLARLLDLRPIGTMAHEWLQAGQATNVRLSESQKYALECWVQEYRGDLGIALSDIFGMDAFLADFDLYFAKLFDGARHDSGDPRNWTEKLIAHYKNFHIDPRTKAAVYSDGLDIPKALSLWQEFEPQIKTSFGIGTNLTCDIPKIQALQIVMKMFECNGQPVAKVSDVAGKGMCRDAEFEAYLQSMIRRKVGQ